MEPSLEPGTLTPRPRARRLARPTIERVEVGSVTIPTDGPESDGTLEWDSTTVVVVRATSGEARGIGYVPAHQAAETLIREKLAPLVLGASALAPEAAWYAMRHAIRNLGATGVGMMALSAIDLALWDLEARVLDLPLVRLLGRVHERVRVYGSGGFTSYEDRRLAAQLGGWAREGFECVKMKVGREPARDLHRVALAREAIGDATELFVDANGAYGRKQALALGQAFFEQHGVSWFEEPRPSDDLEGLRLVRDRAPAGMDVAAGEYGWRLDDFRALLEAGAVDCLQADVTRCGGITGFRRVAALCEAFHVPLSGHCAPAMHLHPAAATGPLRHLEYFHDHVRIERMLFEGIIEPRDGALHPRTSDRPGNGLSLKQTEAEHRGLVLAEVTP